MHQGLDYKLYKIYLWGGMTLYVIFAFLAMLVFGTEDLPGPLLFEVMAFPLMFWVAGIFLYWWWVFLFKGNKELENLIQTQEEGIPGINKFKKLEHIAPGNGDQWW